MPLTFERSADTQVLVDTLRGVNDEITYGTLAQRCKLPPGRIKSCMSSARRILRREKILFGTIIGVGVRRLGDLDKARKTENIKRRLSRTAQREIKDLATIEHFDGLPNIEQIMVSSNRVILHAIAQQAAVIPKAVPEPKQPTEAPNVTKLVKANRG